MAQLVKNPPAMWETWVQKILGLGSSLGWEDPLEKGKATHSSVLGFSSVPAWRSPWDCKELDTTEQFLLHFTLLPRWC